MNQLFRATPKKLLEFSALKAHLSGMRRWMLVAGAMMILAGCASWQSPRPLSDHYYCKADSAVRYRGRIPPGIKNARPAPKTGTCRHQ